MSSFAMLMHDEEVTVRWMRIFGVPEAEEEEEIFEHDACGGLCVGGEVLVRGLGDGYNHPGVWIASTYHILWG
jgi:hypothetical protein